jgi:cyclase
MRLAWFFLFFVVPSFAADYGKTTTTKVADGIYLFTTTGYGDVGLSGNSIAVVSKDGVLLFDTSGTPATARVILQELKKITDEPVRCVVNSHWHWDHWAGNEAVKAAFPKARIISQAKTKEMMMHDSIEWNRDYLANDIPVHIKEIDVAIAKAKTDGSSPERIARLEALGAADKDFLQQKTSLTNTFPDEVFDESRKIKLGEREIWLFHARAITPGDTYVWLPKEKILLSADILVYPIPYAIGGTYPKTWIEALKKIKALEPKTIIPGHGPAETDQTFLDGNIKLFEQLSIDVKQAKQSGLSLDATKTDLEKNLPQYAALIGVDEKSIPPFKGLFFDGFVKNAYLELDHPLSDTPTR